jgi:hypothetical protein
MKQELVDQLFTDWCKQHGLTPEKLDAANLWVREAFNGAMKIRDRYTGNDPEMGFILEGANEGELAAYDYGCRSAEAAVAAVLEDKHRSGSCNQPWQALRERLWVLIDRAKRYEYVRTLDPREYRSLWMRNLHGGGPFDDIVDAAIKERNK